MIDADTGAGVIRGSAIGSVDMPMTGAVIADIPGGRITVAHEIPGGGVTGHAAIRGGGTTGTGRTGDVNPIEQAQASIGRYNATESKPH